MLKRIISRSEIGRSLSIGISETFGRSQLPEMEPALPESESSGSDEESEDVPHIDGFPEVVTGDEIPGERAKSPSVSSVSPPTLDSEEPKPPSPRLAPVQPINVRRTSSGAVSRGSNAEEKEARRIHKRGMVAKEIVHTERAYVERLDVLLKVFLKPLKASLDSKSPLLSEDTIAAIFSNVEDMVPINHGLLSAFDKAMADAGEQDNLGRVMFKYANFLKVYTPFINNFEPMVQRLDTEMEENIAFAEFLEEKHMLMECKGLDLKAHLIQPIQRIPRYIILFEQLLKYTLQDDPEYSDIQKALTTVNSVAVRVNEAVKEKEKRDRLIKIKRTLTTDFDLLRPNRWLVKEGPVTRMARKGPRPTMLYLFNDSLLYGTVQPNGLVKPKRLIMLRECRVRSEDTTTDEEDHAPNTPNTKELQSRLSLSLNALPVADKRRRRTVGVAHRNPRLVHSFELISKVDSFTVYAESMVEKCEWIAALQKEIQVHKDKNSKQQRLKGVTSSLVKLQPLTPEDAEDSSEDEEMLPVTVSDKDATMCILCQTKFTFRNKRRRCQRCKRFVCGNCHFRGNSSFMQLFGHHAEAPTSICRSCAQVTRDKRVSNPPRNSTSSVPDLTHINLVDSIDAPMSARQSRGSSSGSGRRRSNSLSALEGTIHEVRAALQQEALHAKEEVLIDEEVARAQVRQLDLPPPRRQSLSRSSPENRDTRPTLARSLSPAPRSHPRSPRARDLFSAARAAVRASDPSHTNTNACLVIAESIPQEGRVEGSDRVATRFESKKQDRVEREAVEEAVL